MYSNIFEFDGAVVLCQEPVSITKSTSLVSLENI